MRPSSSTLSKCISTYTSATLLCLIATLALSSVGFSQGRTLFERKNSANSGYWQQQVDYEIAVTLDSDGRTIHGTEQILYTNNSPDTLRVLYLKAFANSARKGSLMDLRRRDEEDYSIANSKESQWGSLIVSNVTSRGKKTLEIDLDDTIYKIKLVDPILPGATARFDLEFTTVLPVGIGDRHGFVAGQSKAAYWYPQVCVYDNKMGWVNAPYVGRGECYGDFGDFTVSITAPENRVVTATGLLTNQKQALPDSLREMLDISKFFGERDTWPKFNFDSEKTRTWNFFAKKVNDFAWVAGSDFCIDETTHNGVKIEIYPKRSKAKNWTSAKTLAIQSLETFSEYYGDYGWPAIKVTDSYDGMEYPMLTFCSGDQTKPYFYHLIYHEIGHFWFMGLVGSNQVDRPCLDEGFTTMAEIVAMEKYRGRKGNNVDWSHSWYKDNFYPLDEDRDDRGYRIYLPWAKAGYDLPMVISSDNASEYWAYRNSSYYKPVMMHFTLRAIYGDDLYFEAMRNYGISWRFKHPYEDDFVNSFSGSVDERLDEYFEQWFTSRKQVDYSYKGHKKIEGDKYLVTVAKPGDFVTPIDVALITKAGDTTFYTINPEDHDFIKPGYNDAGTWAQYRRPSREYSFEATVEGGIAEGVIDPTESLPDVNRLNNYSGFAKTETKFDAMFYDVPSMHKYSLRARPDIWFDDGNGVIVGGHLQGSYIKTDNKFSLDAAMGTKSGRPLIDFKYSHPFKKLGRLAFYETRFLRTAYRTYGKYGIIKEYRPRWTGPNYFRLETSFNFLDVDNIWANRRYCYGPSGPCYNSRGPAKEDFITSPSWMEDPLTWAEFSMRWNTESMEVAHSGGVQLRARLDEPSLGRSGSYHLSVRNNFVFKPPGSFRVTASQYVFFNDGASWAYGSPLDYRVDRATEFDAFADTRVFRSNGTFPDDWRGEFRLDNAGLRDPINSHSSSKSGLLISFVASGIRVMDNRLIHSLPIVGSHLSKYDTQLFGQIVDHGTIVTRLSDEQFPERDIDNSILIAGISLRSPSLWNQQRVRFDFPIYKSTRLIGEKRWDFRFSAAWILPLPSAKWVR